jgi:pimeloyl-ACP methyl ester carboxylesterase
MNELKFLELHGDRVAYRDDGDGEVLLLIHGMAGSSDSWRSVLPQLSKKFRVIAPDLLGHGESAKPRRLLAGRVRGVATRSPRRTRR